MGECFQTEKMRRRQKLGSKKCLKVFLSLTKMLLNPMMKKKHSKKAMLRMKRPKVSSLKLKFREIVKSVKSTRTMSKKPKWKRRRKTKIVPDAIHEERICFKGQINRIQTTSKGSEKEGKTIIARHIE